MKVFYVVKWFLPYRMDNGTINANFDSEIEAKNFIQTVIPTFSEEPDNLMNAEFEIVKRYKIRKPNDKTTDKG